MLFVFVACVYCGWLVLLVKCLVCVGCRLLLSFAAVCCLCLLLLLLMAGVCVRRRCCLCLLAAVLDCACSWLSVVACC